MLTITIVSIAGITCAVWLANNVLPFKVCPICAGVSGTWMSMLALSFLGYEIDLVIVAMLMGGSVVGIAYQLEKKLAAGKSALAWKALFIPAGFVVAYSLVLAQWAMLAVSFVLAGAITWAFLKKAESPEQGRRVEELKQKMENCC
jgi:hypothetical protein